MNTKMNVIYTITGIILVTSAIWYLKNRTDFLKKESGKKIDPNNNPYSDLRDTAFSMTPEYLEIQLPEDSTKIYGMIMDWDIGEGTATLVAFLSGDASLYLSSGGGVIGGLGHDKVKKASIMFIAEAENYLYKATKTETTLLPQPDEVNFYFLTNKGKFLGKETISNLEHNTSAWTDLFDEANKLITEIRLITDGK